MAGVTGAAGALGARGTTAVTAAGPDEGQPEVSTEKELPAPDKDI
jgi:hypothetical protein